MHLLAASWRAARFTPALSLVIALLTAGVVLATLLTAGRTVAAERAVLATIDETSITVIEVIDESGTAGLDEQWLRQAASLSTVVSAIGLGPIADMRPVGLPGAEPVPVRHVLGTTASLQHRAPPGAPIGPVGYLGERAQDTTGLVDGTGALVTPFGGEVPVAGTFTTDETLASLTGQVLIRDAEFSGPLTRIIILVDHPQSVTPTATSLRSLTQGTGARVEEAADFAVLRSNIQEQIAGAGRGTVLQTMGAGLALIALAMYASLHSRRRDFGRRRALGATRAQLITLVLTQAALAALPGAAFGAITGALLAAHLAGTSPGTTYPIAIGILATFTTLAAAAIPATVAAYRDPVTALRVP